MKKLFVIIGLVFLTSSCSDDSSENTTKDQIIGNWRFTARIEDFNSEQIDECWSKSTYVFNEDNSASGKNYIKNSNGSCELEGNITGSWRKNGNDYLINLKTPSVEKNNLKAEINGNTMIVYITANGSLKSKLTKE